MCIMTSCTNVASNHAVVATVSTGTNYCMHVYDSCCENFSWSCPGPFLPAQTSHVRTVNPFHMVWVSWLEPLLERGQRGGKYGFYDSICTITLRNGWCKNWNLDADYMQT